MSHLKINSREDAIKADQLDELRHFRDKFIVPEDVIYLTGNSLGVCPRGMDKVVTNVINEWATKLNIAYEVHRWHKGNLKLNENLCKLIGCNMDEIIAEGNTTVNIFKALGTSIALQKIDNPHKRVLVLESGNFTTNNHCAQGLVKLLSTDAYEVRYFDEKTTIEETIKVRAFSHSLITRKQGVIKKCTSTLSFLGRHGSNHVIACQLENWRVIKHSKNHRAGTQAQCSRHLGFQSLCGRRSSQCSSTQC